MSFAIKVDARLKALENEVASLKASIDQFAAEFAASYPETISALVERIKALEAKRGPGRPPKNG